MRAVGFAILGTGLFAARVAPLVSRAAGCRLVAVASRERARAAEFIARLGLEGVMACRDRDLEAIDAIDAVHVMVPNHRHVEWSLRMLAAGKHVLGEKPFTPREDEARRVVEEAERAGRVFAEGFMYLWHPQSERLAWLGRAGDDAANPIGKLKRVRAMYCSPNRSWRSLRTRLRRDMRGGAMMDLGCYCVSIARHVTGEEPGEDAGVRGRARLALPWIPGVAADKGAEFGWTFPSGVKFEGACGFDRALEVLLELEGERGIVRTEFPFAPPRDRAVLRYTRADGRGMIEEVIENGGDRFVNQYEGFARVVRGESEARASGAWVVAQARAMERVLGAMGLGW
jgi:predicted dehydrogenase